MKMTGWLPGVQDWMAARYESMPKWLYHLSLGILSKFPPCCIAYFLMIEWYERGAWSRMHESCNHQRALCWFHHKLCRNVKAVNATNSYTATCANNATEPSSYRSIA